MLEEEVGERLARRTRQLGPAAGSGLGPVSGPSGEHTPDLNSSKTLFVLHNNALFGRSDMIDLVVWGGIIGDNPQLI